MKVAGAASVAWMWLAPLALVSVVAAVQWLPLVGSDDVVVGDGRTGDDVNGSRPYKPLELRGRDIYLREGCGGCHTQLVRRLGEDVMRFGAYSEAGQSRYDRPSQAGIRRLGPDLSRIGAKYPDAWHVRHLRDPRSVVPGSIMPAFPWLAENNLSYADLPGRMRALKKAGAPYASTTPGLVIVVARFGPELAQYYDILRAEEMLLVQAEARNHDGEPQRLTELDALVAYLQVIGVTSPWSSTETD